MTVMGRGAAKPQQVGLPVGLEPVDQLVGQRLDPWPEPLDLPRHEGAIDQRSKPGMDRRLQLEQRIGLDPSKPARCSRLPTPRPRRTPGGT